MDKVLQQSPLRSASATSVVLDGLEAKSGASQFANKTH